MNLSKFKFYCFQINLGFIYSIALFFSFFVYGGFTDQYWFGIFILALICFSAYKIDVVIDIKLTSLALAVMFGLLFLLLNNESAINPLVGDHLYHANIAYAIPLLIIKYKSKYIPEVSAWQILWLYSVGVVSFTILMALMFKKSKQFFCLALIFIGLFILSFTFISGVVNNDPHPPLRSYVLSLLGFFGVNSTVFRIQGLIPLLILTYWIIERDGFNWQTSFFLIFVYSIPVLFFNTLIVEFSIWTFAILTIFLIETQNSAAWSNRKIVLFAIAFTLLGLIRQTATFGLVLLIIGCLFEKNYKILRLIILISLPVVFQIYKSFTNGTPATYDPTEVFLNIPINMGLIERILLSLSLDKYYQILATTGASLLALLFFYLGANIFFKNVKLLIIICIYIVIFWLLFHMIRPILWGVPRYQLEYISPLAVAGFYYINRSSVWIWRALPLFFILLNISFVINAYHNMGNYKIDYPEYFKGETPYFSESIFNTEEAIQGSYAECQGNFHLGESIRENLPLVLAGLSVREVSNSFNYSGSLEFKNNDSKLEDKSVVCSLELTSGFYPSSFYNKSRNTSVLIKFKW